MLKISTLIILLFTSTFASSQVNPLGLYVDIDGKVKYWTAEANYNGNIDDSVFVTCGNSISIQDLRNIKYDHLTILVAADDEWTFPSSGDPSIMYDTTGESEELRIQNIEYSPINFDPSLIFVETSKVKKRNSKKESEPIFKDEFVGVGLTDSINEILKTKLTSFVATHRGKYLSPEDRNALYLELSFYDTVIDKQIFYDYLVDKIITHSYKKGKLFNSIAYHWNYGVEYDSFEYDKKGNLTHFSRESIGSVLKEIDFEYDKKGRVIAVKSSISYAGNSDIDLFKDAYKDEYKFTYDISGKLSSKSTLLENGKWLICNYIIKGKL